MKKLIREIFWDTIKIGAILGIAITIIIGLFHILMYIVF
jgi:hypothetical protein